MISITMFDVYCFVGRILQCAMDVMAMMALNISVMRLSFLCWLYIAVCHVCHNYICTLQCSKVVMTILDVYCTVLCLSLLCWMYIVVCCGFHNYV